MWTGALAFHEKVYPVNGANAVSRLNAFGPPEGTGGPKVMDATTTTGGKGTDWLSGFGSHPLASCASATSKIQSRGQGTGGWYELLGALAGPEDYFLYLVTVCLATY